MWYWLTALGAALAVGVVVGWNLRQWALETPRPQLWKTRVFPLPSGRYQVDQLHPRWLRSPAWVRINEFSNAQRAREFAEIIEKTEVGDAPLQKV